MMYNPYEEHERERQEEHCPHYSPPIYHDYFHPRSIRPIVIPIPIRPPIGRLPFGPGPGRPPWNAGPMIHPWEAPWYMGEPYEESDDYEEHEWFER
jgi:hypothetical protein